MKLMNQILMTGVGSYLPKNKTSNIDLEKWIHQIMTKKNH